MKEIKIFKIPICESNNVQNLYTKFKDVLDSITQEFNKADIKKCFEPYFQSQHDINNFNTIIDEISDDKLEEKFYSIMKPYFKAVNKLIEKSVKKGESEIILNDECILTLDELNKEFTLKFEDRLSKLMNTTNSVSI